MDIHCVKCGEPWSIDTIHDQVEVNKQNSSGARTFKTLQREFATKGCEIFNTSHSKNPDKLIAEASSVMHDLMGDDVDGIASMMEDFEFAGMLND